MRIPQILVALALAFVIYACKKDDRVAAEESLKNDIKDFYALQNKIAEEFQATYTDTVTIEGYHSERLLEWIEQQPEVEEATMGSIYAFDVTHVNGISGHIIFSKKTDNPASRTRGGGGSSSGSLEQLLHTEEEDEEKLIKNKNVLVILQYANEFYQPYNFQWDCKHIQDFLDIFEYSGLGFNVTLRVNEGLTAFRDMDNFGIIVINTHGTTEGLMSGEDVFYRRNRALISFDNNVEVGPLPENAAHRLRAKEYKITSLWEYDDVTRQAGIQNVSYELTYDFFESMPYQFDNAVLIANYCYSGNKNGILADILGRKGLKSFYGYGYNNGLSLPVTNGMCWKAEDTIVKSLIALDTTGVAHLFNNTTPMYDSLYWAERPGSERFLRERHFIFTPQPLVHYLDKGYKLESCRETFTDPRDGQSYPSVCIGDQVWMARNLNFAGAGICYENSGSNCDTYGRLYTIEELTGRTTSNSNPSGVQGLCPPGWHVPSRAEWDELFQFVNFDVRKLRSAGFWTSSSGNTDEFGLKLMPGGNHVYYSPNSIFSKLGLEGHFWTSSSEPGDQFYCSVLVTGSSYNLNADLQYEDFINTFSFSCRCVKD